MTDNPATTATTDQIVDELEKRFPRGFLLATIDDLKHPDTDHACVYWSGGPFQALGLAEHTRNQLAKICRPENNDE